MKKYVLVDGYVSLNNEQLFIEINENIRDIKQRGGWLSVLFTFISISVLNNLRNDEYFKKVFHYFDFGLRILGLLAIVGVLYYFIFLRKSKKKLIINEIIKVETNKKEFETEVTLVFSNKREYDMSFRNLENQLELFLEELKKRNSRILLN